jgi:hypothetical protein
MLVSTAVLPSVLVESGRCSHAPMISNAFPSLLSINPALVFPVIPRLRLLPALLPRLVTLLRVVLQVSLLLLLHLLCLLPPLPIRHSPTMTRNMTAKRTLEAPTMVIRRMTAKEMPTILLRLMMILPLHPLPPLVFLFLHQQLSLSQVLYPV